MWPQSACGWVVARFRVTRMTRVPDGRRIPTVDLSRLF